MKTFVLALATLSVTAMADVKCERDSRPVDGPYVSVELIKNSNGRFDAFYTLITSGFGGPASQSRVQIASNLKCEESNTNSIINHCFKSGGVEGETNSGFYVSLVEETTVGGVEKQYHIKVFSPQLLKNHKKPGYPYSERPGFAEFDFNAEKGSSFMVNRCVNL